MKTVFIKKYTGMLEPVLHTFRNVNDVNNVHMDKLLSVHQLHTENRIPWVKSYKTILRYVSNDYSHILKPAVKGTGSAKRYFVSEKDLKNFIKKFQLKLKQLFLVQIH